MADLNDFSISLQEIKSLSPRVNQGIQLIMVISGELTVEMNSRYYALEEKDLLVINRNQLYQIKGSNHNRVLIVTITDQYMSQHYDAYSNNRFECYSREVDMGREKHVHTLQKLLAETLISYYRKDESYKIAIQSYISNILLILIRRFKHKASSLQRINTSDQRLAQIIHFMEENYSQPITLKSIAEKFYLSAGYLSRYFKQMTDIGFYRFLTKIRLEHAVKDLLYTSQPIGQIAMKNGFPNAKSFAKVFKEDYQVTPNTYRENHQKDKKDFVKIYDPIDASQTIQSRDIIRNLQTVLEGDTAESFNSMEWRLEEITIDVSQVPEQRIVRPEHNLSVGELREVLKEGVRSQLLMAKKDLGLSYVGIRRLIHGSTIIPPVETDEIIATTSPYYNADFALNFLQSHGLSLFVRVDYQEISEDEQHYFTELDLFLKHCLNVYGKSFMESWYFMFYEPYVTAVNERAMHRIYRKLYQTLKNRVPSINVGVFLPFSFKEKRTSKHHQWMMEKDVPMDFIGYEANQNGVIDFEELGDERFAFAGDYIKERTLRLKGYLRKHYKEKPLHLVSWNTLSGNTRYTNGTFFRGALVFKNALEIANEVKTIGFWINTEQHEKSGKNRDIRLEGMELYHYFSGKRPAYFAMQFLEHLNGDVIAAGETYIMTENESGYQLVLMNCNNVNPYYSTEETFLKKLNKTAYVTISNLDPGDYQIRKRVFDQDNGALYKKWWDLNSKYGMDKEVIEYIIQTSQPSLELFDETFDEEWSFYSYLTLNAIHFFDIRRAVK
ncbi:helix-turn-helix domain-containing protein [Virgibacillus siamensis]|uniref:helix-turn-helix domain-containing protein n=1 Tax=Virgibacillus siamensis TaxID=480071 RepID=UPI0009878042|nr:helix-turn-helix domain-containing protein [Virgibacillus siamensis]